MAKLFLQRHLKSEWNKLNIWAGWCDNPLSDVGRSQAPEIAELLKKEKIDVIYVGSLMRNLETVVRVYEFITDRYPLFLHRDGGKMQEWGNFIAENAGNYILAIVTETLNERYYGEIQSMNKDQAKQKYGEELVHQWRRAYHAAPPGGESGEDTYRRVMPYFEKEVQKELREGKNVLMVGSHNNLRALVKYLERISDDDYGNLELGFGALRAYEFDEKTGAFTFVS